MDHFATLDLSSKLANCRWKQLSTTKAKYNACSGALCNAIPIMFVLLEEATAISILIKFSSPKVHCKLFCNNSGMCKLICLSKMRPRTKHINTTRMQITFANRRPREQFPSNKSLLKTSKPTL
jgi:hypothetical protein